MKEFKEAIMKLPYEYKPVNKWIPNPNYNESLRGKVKSHQHETNTIKMINLEDVLKLIQDYESAGKSKNNE